MRECPNLRWVRDKKTLLGWNGHYECSVDREKLDGKYVGALCRYNEIGEKNFWDRTKADDEAINNKYKECRKFKFFGIRN